MPAPAPTFVPGRVEVSVPASSANLGPGYDALGLALDLRDEITVELSAAGLDIEVAGSGSGEVPEDEANLVYRSMARAFAAMGCGVPGLSLRCRNVIPHGRGLGSSSAAIVGGICAARGLVVGGPLLLDDRAVLALAADVEGHPDNVAAAFLGGFTIACGSGDQLTAAHVGVDPRISAIVFVAPQPLETTVARGLLPEVVPHADAAANAGRAALLVAALSQQPQWLLAATEDRLHQDYREPAMPVTLRLIRDLRSRGVAAVVSGAGPSVLALVDSADHPLDLAAPEGWRLMSLRVDAAGAVVSPAPGPGHRC